MRIGFIGTGKMAAALVRGLLDARISKPDEIRAYDRHAETLAALVAQTGILPAPSNIEVINDADIILLCVKPGDIGRALAGCAVALRGKLLLSIAAGVSTTRLQEIAGAEARIVRAMPNLAVQVKQGAIAYASGAGSNATDLATAAKIFSSVGHAFEVAERDLDAITGLSGSGPAYAFMVIEALSDGGVAAGLSRALSTRLAAQVLLGAAGLVIESGEHPAVLREAVTSPAGTTAAALAVLEHAAVRSAFIEAVRAATERSRELG